MNRRLTILYGLIPTVLPNEYQETKVEEGIL